ncbi:MAG: single-stranded DNA-binding protein [Flavobacteriia bacterium]|nr:single-stranded DNA-binding protein [Flavobacteriia bacterium]
MNTLRNKVSLIGRVGQKPEIKPVGNDYSLTRFSIAINEGYKDKNGQWKENTTWHNVMAWGKTAERITKIVEKGQEVMIEGKIVNKSYEKDGEKRYSTDIEVLDFLLLSSKNQDNLDTINK